MRRWSAAEAASALEGARRSGLSLQQFARREGVSVQRLRSWEQRIGPAAGHRRELPAFVELRGGARDVIEIVLRSGIVLRVAPTVDANGLRRIVNALETVTC